MIFRVENLGPLREAEVDLSKDLIVLTGPNNSGKTYLAWAVYGLFRTTPKSEQAFLDEVVEKLVTSPIQEIEVEDLTGYWEPFLSQMATQFSDEIERCFAAEVDYFEGAKLSVALNDPSALTDLAKKISSTAIVNDEDGRGIFWGLSSASGRLKVALSDTEPRADLLPGFSQFADYVHSGETGRRIGLELSSLPAESRQRAKEAVGKAFSYFMRRTAFGSCTLFPAERIAVNMFAKELALKRTELVDELLDTQMENGSIKPLEMLKQRAGRYALPIRDSLRVANDLADISKRKSRFEPLAEELETSVLGGKVAVSELGEMTFTPESASHRQLGLHLTASVVKSLSSLVFYFRHMARKGDFLIIDEPELNLHPDNQRKIARVLAKAVNRGFKIMMSTHSDYIIRELNLLIMLSQPSDAAKKLIDELGYDPASILKPEKVGVYLFNDHRSQPVPVTETGFEVKTIEDEINKLNSASQRVYSGLFD